LLGQIVEMIWDGFKSHLFKVPELLKDTGNMDSYPYHSKNSRYQDISALQVMQIFCQKN
jgi:hypothetical protein